MGIVEVICNVLSEILGALSNALPQLDSVWSQLGDALESFCGQFDSEVS